MKKKTKIKDKINVTKQLKEDQKLTRRVWVNNPCLVKYEELGLI